MTIVVDNTKAPMAGIISSAQQPDPNAIAPTATSATNPTPTSGVAPVIAGAQNLTASPTQAAGYNAAQLGSPTSWNVTAPQTVAGQVAGITAENSPIIQQARTQANETMNQRGLLNSSLGLTAADSAVYSAALPIAQADAATHAKAAGYNADQSNQFAVTNAGALNTAGKSNADAVNTLNTANLSADTQKSIANLNSQTQLQLNSLDNSTKLQMQTLQNQNAQLLQSNSAAATLFGSATTALTSIAQNPNMDSGAKTAASAQIWGNLQAQLGTLTQTSSLNLGSLLGDNPYGNGSYAVPESLSPQIIQAQNQAALMNQQVAQQSQPFDNPSPVRMSSIDFGSSGA